MITKKQPLALYVHIPFCVKKCNYCDFLSGPATRQSQEAYVDALLHEIRSYRCLAQEYQIQSVFLGGGTPSAIEACHITRIMRELESVFGFMAAGQREIEITMEMNPGTVDEDKLLEYYQAGINRISFGLQSANDEELKMLGRIHTYEQFVENYRSARKAGFKNINVDLMSALPGQTIDSFTDTLEKVMELQPEHISAYSLIIEEGTPFYELFGEDSEAHPDKQIPSEEDDRRMYDLTRQRMHEYGYERYEISNYAKPGYECRHNCTYWQRGDYLGIGSGAASLINHCRYSNLRELHEYMEAAMGSYDLEDVDSIRKYHEQIHAEEEALSIQDEMEEFMFLGLRMMKGVSLGEFRQYFHKELYDVYEETIKRLQKEKLVTLEQDRLKLTLRGIDISNYVMSEFLLD